MIENLAGMRAEVLELEPGALREADARLTAFSGHVDALFLPHTSPEVACRRAMAGVPVLTGQDTTAIALAAAVSTLTGNLWIPPPPPLELGTTP